MSCLPMIILKEDGDTQIPFPKYIYDIFSPRCKSLIIWSFGLNTLGLESSLVEAMGSHVHIFDSRPEAKEIFEKGNSILSSHKADDSSELWQTQLASKFILPNRLHFSDTLPYSFSGTLSSAGGLQINVKEYDLSGTPRVDIMKINYGAFNQHLVYSFLNAGYRPGLVFVHWDEHPDENTASMLCAGHLQNCGYILLGSKGPWFLYMFINQNIYETCSWNRIDTVNPMLEEFKLALTSKKEE